MEPVIALIGVTVVVLLVNRVWLRLPRGFEVALRAGVAAVFTLTGIAHFVGMRADLIDMVPDRLPAPGAVITITGLLELAAAAAMIHRRLATLAALGLTGLLVAMFPANVDLALSGEPLPWWDELIPRTIMQAVFLAATITVAVLTHRPAHRSTDDDITRTTVRTRGTGRRGTPSYLPGDRRTHAASGRGNADTIRSAS
jgi:uncharacterized membrane protein